MSMSKLLQLVKPYNVIASRPAREALFFDNHIIRWRLKDTIERCGGWRHVERQTGIPRERLIKYVETARPSVEALYLLSTACGVSVDYLLGSRRTLVGKLRYRLECGPVWLPRLDYRLRYGSPTKRQGRWTPSKSVFASLILATPLLWWFFVG